MLRKLVVIVTLVLLVAVGCSERDDSSANPDAVFPEAEFSVSPEQAGAGDEITFTATVTEGGEAVTDADVRFEIWLDEHEDEEHDMIPIEHSDNGNYTLKKAFTESGSYSMYYHIDTNGIHLMQKHHFTIE